MLPTFNPTYTDVILPTDVRYYREANPEISNYDYWRHVCFNREYLASLGLIQMSFNNRFEGFYREHWANHNGCSMRCPNRFDWSLDYHGSHSPSDFEELIVEDTDYFKFDDEVSFPYDIEFSYDQWTAFYRYHVMGFGKYHDKITVTVRRNSGSVELNHSSGGLTGPSNWAYNAFALAMLHASAITVDLAEARIAIAESLGIDLR